jgi:hypothetical protein
MRRRSFVGIAVVFALLCGCGTAAAQNLVEVRLADTNYRYVDWNYTFKRGAVVDLFYVGVPGSNEFNLGGGYTLKAGPVVLTPLVYGVFGKEDSQRGVKVAFLVAFDKGDWKVLSFAGAYFAVNGAVTDYQVLDTLDVTRKIGRRCELGVQAGFFHSEDSWNPQVGPLLKINDTLGAWALSYRFGPQPELRFGRVLTF